MEDKKINVIMVAPDLSFPGGISTVIQEYLAAGIDKKVNFYFVPTIKPGNKLNKIFGTIVFLFRLTPLLWAVRPAIVHLHVAKKGSFYRKFLTFLLAKVFGAKTVVHLHSSQFEDFMNTNFLNKTLSRFMFHRSDCILALSYYWQKRLNDLFVNDNIRVFYNPIRVNNPKPSERNYIHVVYLGHLWTVKGTYDLLDSIAKESAYFRGAKVKFTLAGDGEVEKVRQYVRNNELEDIVHVPGWVTGEEKEKLLQSTDIIILPSHTEQLPMSVLEGMGHGISVIATNVGGIPEMIEDGKNGILFAPKDLDAMVNALKRLCEDRELRSRMGSEGQQTVLKRFESQIILDQLLGIYQGFLLQQKDVIMVNPDISFPGGIPTVIKEYLSAGLDKRVHLYFVSTIKQEPAFVKILRSLSAFLWFPVLILSLPKAIVHFHVSQKGSFYRKVFLFSIAVLFRKKTVMHLHGSEFEKFMFSNSLNKTLTKWMFDHASCVLVLSSLWNEKLRKFSTNKNIVTLYNPVSAINIQKLLGQSNNILFLGRLGERKGIYDLLNCINLNAAYFRQKNAKFVLAGDGDVVGVKNFVKKHQLNDLVSVPGWISGETKKNLLITSEILTLPSYSEQMPMSVLEGMGYGFPIVATNVDGIPEMVENGVNGFLFNPGNTEAMFQAFKMLMEDLELRKKMGKESLRIVKEKFETGLILDQLESVYEKLA